MEQFGEVLSCKIKKNSYGYVQFDRKEDADKALEKLNGETKWGKKLELEIFKPQKDRESDVKN